MINHALQGTLKRRVALGTTSEPHLLTEIVPTLSTDSTRAAWNANFKGYAIIDLKAFDLGADGNDDAG